MPVDLASPATKSYCEREARKAESTYDATPSQVELEYDYRRRYPREIQREKLARANNVIANDGSNKSSRRVVQLLLAAGADPTSLDENGHWPIDVATMLGCADIVDELSNSTSTPNHNLFDASAELLLALGQSAPVTAIDDILLPDDRVLPHVKDVPSLLPSLLDQATDRDLSNIPMVEYLATFIPEVPDKEAFTNSLNKLPGGSRWWHPHGLSILLRAGPTPNEPQDSKYTNLNVGPLHTALPSRHTCHWRDLTARILLKFGADPNPTSSRHGYPLNIAIEVNRSTEIIGLLIKRGGFLSVGYKDHEPPLLSAISSKRDDALEILLKAGADPNGTNKDNPLVRAMDPKSSDAAVSILLQYGANPLHPLHDNTSTAFHEICRANHRIQRLVSTGLDLNARFGQGCTPLMKVRMGCPKEDQGRAVLALVNLGADVKAMDDSGSTALHYAICSGYLQAIQALLEHGAETTPCNNEGHTPLRCGLSKYRNQSYVFDAVATLLDTGANPLEVFSNGKTALHYVAMLLMDYSNIDQEFQFETEQGADHFTDAWNLYNRFLNAGCDPAALEDRYVNPEDCAKMADWHGLREIDNDGNTLLHTIAYRDGGVEPDDYEANLFQIFVDLGLSPWTENKQGLTALDIASIHEKKEILALFDRDD
ncbi:hypothetical protein N7478_002394 [Penicillium angulare]|uniref:uncharacterized protein n=1 Tax=Penicillium angulare TaxID=116970 RepID=UPI00253FDA14|nr:uncharacterized protein N7478_002394 [Penicillium angulare]KAJ5286708.1 hypothetical protein N7478_002394 [Penicillium angulare]